MILYLDSSSMAKLYAEEPGSAEIAALVANAAAVATSVLAYAEVRSALARKRRERMLTASQLSVAKQLLDSDWATLAVLPCDGEIARRAGALAEAHALRASDAVHLAAFERLLSSTDEDEVEFACSDERLKQAARKLG